MGYMGALRLRKRFAARTAGLLVSAALLTGCTGSVIEQFNSVSGGDCISAADRDGFTTAEQRRLNGILETIRQTPTGRHIMTYSERARTSYCFNTAMRGGDANAVYYPWANRSDILPKASDARMTGSVVHEARHRQQQSMGVRWLAQGNVPLVERTLMKELIEADARLAAIVYAHEMRQRGDGSYMDALRKDSTYRPMVRAFEREFANSGGNMLNAMETSMQAFRENRSLHRHYERSARRTAPRFDENERPKALVTPKSLERLGRTAYGNYMSDELVRFMMNELPQADEGPTRQRQRGLNR